ncbi:transposase [Penicillium cataractarum]|uniref:Transposase n=1 Tax=Penicillium cataractarum TaxID=2100454 RepID=A0A9W9RE57_9EURO|nr:transposase [Penicillium cataractarum]KAJ5358431.1 transposase [Penicillium cataractarum]
MPKNAEFDESRIAEACKAVLLQKKPKIAKIAREFGVSRTTLSDRVKKAKSPTTPPKSQKNVLDQSQEKALVNWIVQMHGWNLPPTPTIPDRQVSKNWPYLFMKRLPKDLGLSPVKQKTKELKRIQAEDAGLL